jgi:hypothetical protein
MSCKHDKIIHDNINWHTKIQSQSMINFDEDPRSAQFCTLKKHSNENDFEIITLNDG